MSRSIKTPALAALTGGLMLAGSAFASTPLVQGYMLAADAPQAKTDTKAAEAKCGADKKTGEMACGAAKAKAGEKTCGAHKAKTGEMSCGANKPKAAAGDKKAADTKMAEGKCGEGKCGGSI